jgi:hypothetical protein
MLAVGVDRVADVLTRAAMAGVPATDIGVAAGDRLVSADFDVALAAAADAWRNAIPRALAQSGDRGSPLTAPAPPSAILER